MAALGNPGRSADEMTSEESTLPEDASSEQNSVSFTGSMRLLKISRASFALKSRLNMADKEKRRQIYLCIYPIYPMIVSYKVTKVDLTRVDPRINRVDDSMQAVVWLEEVGKEDVSTVGGKGASLGEMINLGIPVPGGFAVTAQAFRDFLNRSGIAQDLFDALKIDVNDQSQLMKAEEVAKRLIMDAKVPTDMEQAIKSRYQELCERGWGRGFCGGEKQCHGRGLAGCQLRWPAGDLPEHERCRRGL